MRKIIFLGLIVFFLSACQQNEINEQNEKENGTDKFDLKYEFDANSHWVLDNDGNKTKIEDHKFSEWIENEDFTKTRTCEICSFTDKHTHTFENEYSFTQEEHFINSTCGDEIFKNKSSHTLVTTYYSESGEFYEKQSCETCGYNFANKLDNSSYVGQFGYYEQNDGTLRITSFGQIDLDQVIVLPTEHDGKKVTSVSLAGNELLKSEDKIKLFIPKEIISVGQLGNEAGFDLYFEGTLNDYFDKDLSNVSTFIGGYLSSLYVQEDKKFVHIENLEVPNNITKIEKGQFAGYDFKTIKLHSVEEVKEYSFSSCTQLKEIDFGSNDITIKRSAFEGCGFNKLVIPNNVTLERNAFFGNHHLYDVEISNGSTVNKDAFVGCIRLVKLINNSSNTISNIFGLIDESNLENSKVFYYDDFVFAKVSNEYKLIDYIGNEDVLNLPTKILDEGNIIESYTLNRNSFAYELLVPNTLERHQLYKRIKEHPPIELNIPRSVSLIENEALSNSFYIEKINVDFTEAEFSEICKDNLNGLVNRISYLR